MSARRGGLAMGLCVVALATCADPTSPPRPPVVGPLIVSVADSAIELSTIGTAYPLVARVTRDGVPRTIPVYWWSTVDTVARVDADGTVTARAAGDALVYAASDSGGLDSVRIVVAPIAETIELTPQAPLLQARVRDVVPIVRDAGGSPIGAGTLAWSSSDTNVAVVSPTGRVLGRGVGETTIRASRNSVSGSTTLTVRPMPRLRLPVDTVVLAAGARLHVVPVLIADSTDERTQEQAAVTAVVEDTTIAFVTSAFPVPLRSSADPVMQMVGRAVGVTRVRFSAPGWQAVEVVLDVRPIRIELAGVGRLNHVPGGLSFGVAATLRTAADTELRSLEPRVVRLHTPDTTLLVVDVDSVIAGGGGFQSVTMRTRAEGVAHVIASAPRLLPDTVRIDIRSRGLNFAVNQFDAPFSVRRGYNTSVLLASSLYDFVTAIPVTLAQRRPDLVRLPSTPLTISGNRAGIDLRMAGLAVGTDTVIATAPGHRPDTLIVHVEPTTFTQISFPDSITFLSRPSLYFSLGDFADSEGVLVRVVSSDSTVLRPDRPEFRIAPFSGLSLGFTPTGTGTATLSLVDSSGVHLTRVSPPIRVLPSKLRLRVSEFVPNPPSMGVRQRRTLSLDAEAPWSSIAAGRIRSSDPTVVRVLADSFSTAPTTIEIESGDAPGSAWIIASGAGLAADSIRITVTRGRIDLGPGGPVFLRQTLPFNLPIRVRDANGFERISQDSIFLKVRSTDRRKLQLLDSVVVIPAGSSLTGVNVTTWAAGPVGVTLVPMRPLRANIDAGTTSFLVLPTAFVESGDQTAPVRETTKKDAKSDRSKQLTRGSRAP